MKGEKMKIFFAMMLVLCMLFALVSCNQTKSDDENTENTESNGKTENTENNENTENTEDKNALKRANLEDLMLPLLGGNNGTVLNETVMFIDYGDEKTLLYPIDTIISVTSYDGSKTYSEGKDYTVVDGKLKIPEGSAIPCITSAVYYNYTSPTAKLMTMHNGKVVETYCGAGQIMTKWQVNVNYTHKGEWDGFAQECLADSFKGFLTKLENGEDVTVMFYGDSISTGSNTSWHHNYAPYQYPYTLMFTNALADLYGYEVRYINTGITNTPKIPGSNYKAGTNGTITYINSSIGGWMSDHGVSNFDKHVKPFIEQYGCDLFMAALGMNDIKIDVKTTASNVKKILDGVWALDEDCSALIISTMVPNPADINRYGNQPKQESPLKSAAAEYVESGRECGVACVTSTSLSILQKKIYSDCSGNNVNHPNDFFARIYAQTMMQALIGYENMK